MSGTMPSGFLAKFNQILNLHTSHGQIRRKLGFSASYWLFQPIRRQEDVSHVWDHVHCIPGQILPHFDPSHLSVGQLTGKLGFSASQTLEYSVIMGVHFVIVK